MAFVASTAVVGMSLSGFFLKVGSIDVFAGLVAIATAACAAVAGGLTLCSQRQPNITPAMRINLYRVALLMWAIGVIAGAVAILVRPYL